MTFRQLLLSLKKSKLLLFLVVIFFLKQLLLVAAFPIFQGPDEPAHYSTIQYYAQSQETKDFFNDPEKASKSTSKTFDFSEEIAKTKDLVGADKIAFKSSQTQAFTNISEGKFEQEINNNKWSKIIPFSKPKIVSHVPGYYYIPSLIEKSLSNFDIFIRFFAERIFSAFLGILIILLIYLIARKIGWDEKISLLLATLIAFQPMFSQTAAIINYDILLIFTFTLFTYGAIWSLKDGLNWTNGTIMILATVLGLITKSPAIVLALLLFILAIYFAKKYLQIRNDYFIAGTIIITLLVVIIFENFAPRSYVNLLFQGNNVHFDSVSQSVSKYISETQNRWSWSELSYWGNFGWLDAAIPSWMVNLAHLVEILSIGGLLAYFVFPKKIPEFLPKKIIVIFLLGIFFYLQLAIRFADWSYFNNLGRIELGTHGRYFLPVIAAQFILIAIGLGMLVRKYDIWKNILKVLSLSMILLWIYSMLIIIIPRYYL